jgi:hypothetical protein
MVQLSCGKAPVTLVTYSQMPSIMIFQDGSRALADIHTSDLGKFVKEGGWAIRSRVCRGWSGLLTRR